MAIEDGVVRGFRVTKKEQLQSGRLIFIFEPFSEGFSGQFSGIVALPLNIQYNVTAGDEIFSDVHASCQIDGELAGRTRFYPKRQVPRPTSRSVTICSIGGNGVKGVSYGVGEDPVTISAPPCGPLPTVFWSNRPPPPNPYGGGLSGWEGTTYGYWGGLPTI